MNKEFLLELYSGEIPSLLQAPAAKQLQETIDKELQLAGIEGFNSMFFYSARRLTLMIENLEPFTKEQNIEQRGPKVSANPAGIEAFAKSHGMTIEQLEKKEYKGDIHYYCLKSIAAQKVEILLSRIVEKTLAEFSWPKSMKWDETNVRWVRPLLNILALYNENIVPINFGNLESNNQTLGHFFSDKIELKIKDFSHYVLELKKHKVLLNQDERKKLILKAAKEIAENLNLELIEDERLIDEVSGLVEYPNLLVGTIDQKFLTLPSEVLQCSIRTHQKYLCLKDKKGNFADKFIVVANSQAENNEIVIRGNERVLTARLNDAVFFYREDRKISLKDRFFNLEKITFHNKIGSLQENVQRIMQLANVLNHRLKFSLDDELVAKICQIAKSDLTCDIVREFPELQGIMGYYYALDDGYNHSVALAIKEQYMPRGPSDKCPTDHLSIVLALGDKIVSLYGLWYAGEKPTGSKDSFGLRRLALGIVRIITENKLSLELTDLLEVVKSWYGAQGTESSSAIVAEVHEFIVERFRNYLKADYDYKILDCLHSINDLYKAKVKLDQISKSYNDPANQEAFSALKRVLKFNCSSINNDGTNDKLLTEKIEIELSSYIDTNVLKELDQLLKLDKLINSYFEGVTINHSDEKIKINRHNFVKKLQSIILDFADFSNL